VSQRLLVFHPTIRLENASRTAGEPEDTLAGRDAGSVGHSEPVGLVGGELPVDPIRRRRGGRVLPGDGIRQRPGRSARR
jgi:hypothetical protein